MGPPTTPETASLSSTSLLADPVLQAMALGVAVVRVADLVVVAANPAWQRLFHPVPEPQVLYSPAGDAQQAAGPIRRGLSADGTWTGTVRARRGDEDFWCRVTAASSRDETHRAVWVLTATDVTAEQDAVSEARSAIARQRSEAAALLRVHGFKDEFLTVVSHDLRTPLTAVRGFVDLLRTGRGRSDPAGLASMLDRMATSLQDMTLLVDRLLYWGMLQSGTASIAPRPLRLQDEVHGVVEQVADLVRDRDVRTQVPGDLVALVDPLALERMLVQLLANAVKYSAPGSRITVTAAAVETDDDDPHPVPEVVVAVTDEGRGIRRERLAALGARLDDGTGPATTGPTSGLGLGIVQRYAALHGGRVRLESRHHHGTTVSFTLPGRSRPL